MSRAMRIGQGVALALLGALSACGSEPERELARGEVVGEAADELGLVTAKITGAVGVSGSNMLGANRLTQGPCPGTPYQTASTTGTTIKVSNAEIGNANWDCGAPEFFFGSTKGTAVNISSGIQEFKFSPPAGFKCDGTRFYDQGALSSPFLFSTSGNNCTTTLDLGNTAHDAYLWFFVKPTLVYKVAGAVGIFGSDMLGSNRLTQGPCPGKPFKTASSLSSTIKVGNAQLGEANWNCNEPSFYFGDALNQNVSLDAGTQVFNFTPPAGYACEWYSLYGDRTGQSFAKSGASCSVTATISNTPGELYVWFYVKPV